MVLFLLFLSGGWRKLRKLLLKIERLVLSGVLGSREVGVDGAIAGLAGLAAGVVVFGMFGGSGATRVL